MIQPHTDRGFQQSQNVRATFSRAPPPVTKPHKTRLVPSGMVNLLKPGETWTWRLREKEEHLRWGNNCAEIEARGSKTSC